MGGHESIDEVTRLVAQIPCSFSHIPTGSLMGGHESIDELTRLAAQMTRSFAHIPAGGVTGSHKSILQRFSQQRFCLFHRPDACTIKENILSLSGSRRCGTSGPWFASK